jgi:ABC-type phosphate transport system auxiliary subunit
MKTTMTEDQFRQLLEQNNVHLLARFDERLEEKNAGLFGQLSQHFDAHFDALRDELKTETDRIYTAIDGLTKRIDTDEQERAATNVEQKRQNGWIGQLAKATNTKLVPEQ